MKKGEKLAVRLIILASLFLWSSYIVTIFSMITFPAYFSIASLVPLFLILYLIFWIYTGMIFALQRIWRPIWSFSYSILATRLQFDLEKSAMIIYILQAVRFSGSIILLGISFLFPRFPFNLIILLTFVIFEEVVDSGFDSVLYANFPKKKRHRFYNLDDYTDWATRMIFYIPYYLRFPNFWILGIFLLHLVTNTLTVINLRLRWIKFISPDLNFALIFYFFLPPLFPLVLFGSFCGYLTIYIHYLFPDFIPYIKESRSSYVEFLDTFEEIEEIYKK